MLKATAEEIYARLTAQGFQARDLVNVSTQLLALVTKDIAGGAELAD
jgi:hypothetical protein